MIKLNDIFVCSWGYDQTNVDYYQVTKIISEKTIEVTPVKSIYTHNSNVKPHLNEFCGDSFKRRVKKWYDGTPAINGEASFIEAKLWDNSPCYETPPNCGH